MSVDGTRDSVILQEGERLVLAGCRDGKRLVTNGNVLPAPGTTEPCTPEPRYLADLPTDPNTMLDYLRRNATGTPGHPNSLGKYVGELARMGMSPKSRAALFEAGARLPGLSLIRGATDGAGRRGAAISWSTADGYNGTIVFDEKTHAYLGSRQDAVLVTAVVDKVGQR